MHFDVPPFTCCYKAIIIFIFRRIKSVAGAFDTPKVYEQKMNVPYFIRRQKNIPMKLKTIIVDDENNARENLKMLLEDYCPEVEVVALAESGNKAKELIDLYDPKLLFLDIKMPGEDGFTFLSSLSKRNFSVVFVTAHNQFALKAFKANAVDYIEKPVDIDDLKNAVNKVVALRKEGQHGSETGVQRLLDGLVSIKTPGTVAIPTSDGFIMARMEDIVYLEADENYTTLHLAGGKKYLSCGSIKRYEDILEKNMFFRTHRSFIVNVAYHLKEFSRKEGNMVIMSNGAKIPVSRRILPEFLGKVNTI